jgi:hypothetical protein
MISRLDAIPRPVMFHHHKHSSISRLGASPGSVKSISFSATTVASAKTANEIGLLLIPRSQEEKVMNTDEPLGYFITWTVYGSFLQGDERWWRKKRKGSQPPQPQLEQWHRDRLRHDVILLSDENREIVESEIRAHCEFRQW